MFEAFAVNHETTALPHHIFDFIETLEQTHFDRAVLLCVGEVAAMAHVPFPYDLIRQEDADRESCLAVGGDVKDVLCSRILAHAD